MFGSMRAHNKPFVASATPGSLGFSAQVRRRRPMVTSRSVIKALRNSSASHSAQSAVSKEVAQLKADLTLLDASIGSLETQLKTAETSNRKGWEAQAQYDEEIAALTADIAARKQQQQAGQSADETEDVRQMLSRVETLREEAADMSLTLTERKGEIDSLKQQLSEFEESAQPLRAYALAGLREREAEMGGVATVEREDDSNANWGNDWGRIQLDRVPETLMPPRSRAPGAVAIAAAPEEPRRNVLRHAGLPGLVLAAGVLAVANAWKAVKDALPKEMRVWLDVGAASLAIGAAGYTSLSK